MGGRLQPLFDATPIRRACIDMAETGGRRMTEITRMNTPVGHQPHLEDYVPGRLRASIKQKPLKIGRRGRYVLIYESGVETDVEYAPHVEHGTGLWGPHRAKYLIRPKTPGGVLSWITPSGERVFAKAVLHPGSPGQHMFAIGAEMVEFEFHNFGQRRIAQWARETERQGMRQRPVFYGRRMVA